MQRQSVRTYLAELERRGVLASVAETVDPRFEISAHLCLAGAGPALRFERINGHRMRVFGNLLCSRERIALGLGTTVAKLQQRIVAAIDAPLAPRPVRAAPCQAVAIDQPDLATLPIPTFFEHETGPYLTAGA
ncbi:MAG: UbiD family decarboxylase, partial [Burkholderiales bacterium]